MQAVIAPGHFSTGRHSGAASGGKAVREQPNFLISLRVAAASYVSAGRSEGVHQAIAQASIRSKYARFPISRITSCNFGKNIRGRPAQAGVVGVSRHV
jgi:hypothetical protein